MHDLARRTVLTGVAASALGLAAGPALAVQRAIPLTMHRDPNCGCCHKWAAIAGRSGFAVKVAESDDIMAVKKRLGVPASLIACHTSEVGGYVVEGHVPMAAIHRLLREKPRHVAGIALPGMPLGSPGMETADGRSEPLKVMAFDREGNATAFSG
jgi:hypothetical protein